MKSRKEERSHIFIGWELGGGLGHLTRIAAIARLFFQRGYKVTLCLADLSQVYNFVSHLPVALYQAPVWRPGMQTERGPVCFSDIFQNRGYRSAKGLHSLTSAWLSLVENLQPDLLLLDYSPTALLATRGLNIPKVLISSGFGELCPGQPDICLRPWYPSSQEITEASERLVVGIVNRILKNRGVRPIRYVSDLYEADHIFLLTIPELDIVENRSNATYLSPPEEEGNLPKTIWPEGEGPKIFAYVKQSSRFCLPTIESIAKSNSIGLIFCPGLPKETAKRFQRSGLEISSQPYNLAEVLAKADVIACHAGKTTVTHALLEGKPLLLIPEQLEQLHTALRVEKTGAGILVRGKFSQAQIESALTQLVTKTNFRDASLALAKKNAALTEIDSVTTIVNHCEQLKANSLSWAEA